MIVDIGNTIIDRIQDLPFLDKYSGVVKTLTRETSDGTGKTIKQTFPGSCTMNEDECNGGRYLDLCPDSKKKSVLFLEDNGIRFRSVDGTKIQMVASLDLICWLNLPLLGVENCSFSGRAIAAIISKLIGKGVPFNNGIYQQLMLVPIAEKSKNINPFSKYSFDEAKNQFLIYPYDSFVLSIEANFIVNSRCFDEIVLGEPNNCQKS